METSKKNFSKAEIIISVFNGLLILGGLVLIIFGLFADYLPIANIEDYNWSGQSTFASAMHMSYRWFGLILFLAGTLLAVIFLNYFAKKSDTNNEREQRRAQRMKIISDSKEQEPTSLPNEPKEVTVSETAALVSKQENPQKESTKEISSSNDPTDQSK